MSLVNISSFNGLRPIMEPRLLGLDEATVARNVRLTSGSIQPLGGTNVLRALKRATPQTIWRYGTDASEQNHWLEFSDDTDVVHSPIPNDQWARAYWSDGVKPKYAPNSVLLSGTGAYPGGSYDLGVPAPATAITFTSFTPQPSSALGEKRIYTYTYVTAYGEEGPPGPDSAVADLDPTAPVTIGGMSPPSGAYNITSIRIYRSSTVGTAAAYQFVAEIPVSSTSYVDTKTQADLGEVLLSEDWGAPPATLKGLKMMASGSLIGFTGNNVHLSEPNMPHAWPHRFTIDLPVVGVGVFRQSAVILTNGYPYIMTGVDPAAMTPERLEIPQACLSKRSIVDAGDGVIYASPDGLVSIGSGGISILTLKLMTAQQWMAYNPASMIGVLHDNRYHAFYTKLDGTRGELIFDFSGQGAIMTESSISADAVVTAAYADARSDTLYVAKGANILRFNKGAAMTAVWRSRIFRTSYPVNMSVAAVDAEAYPVTMRVYANDQLRMTKTVSSDRAFTMPSGYRADNWQFELEAATEVTRLRVATSMAELKS